MSEILRVLIVEDLPTDAELCERKIRQVRSSCEFRRVETREEYLAALESFKPDIIVSDFKLPHFDGLTALKLAQEHTPATPFLIITGSMNEDTAVECMKAGAWDYVIKEHLKRLGPAVLSALAQKTVREEKQRSGEAARESEERYKALFDRSLDCVYIHDFKGNFIDANPAALALLGYNREEIQSLNFASLLTEGQLPLVFQTLEELRNTGAQKEISEYRLRHKNGKILEIETKASVIYRDRKPYAIQGLARDITERKRAEQEIKMLSAVVERSTEGMAIADLDGNIIFVNEAWLSMHGYIEPEKLLGKSLAVFHNKEQMENVVKPFNQRAIKLGAYSGEVGHITRDGKQFPTLMSTIVLKDKEGKPYALAGIARDISERKRAEKALEESNEKLRKTIHGVIQALAMTVESRDLYTSGHQKRVSNLACAIAAEMGLSTDQIEAIYMAGILHDIGKISIPAEILSKPGRLSEHEFGLIKSHPQVAYDILKGIKFPWPLARIVLQHHERMDGSGYPLGLLGENILLEARILAVADTVEAMASHRPYRAALGIEAGLEIIRRNKIVLYDHRVVDACIRLFEQKGFKFDSGREMEDLKRHLGMSTNI